MLYFAYGSNMDGMQMRERCPQSRFLCIGSLAGHALCFPRFSARRKGGVASITPRTGAVVWGIVYELSEVDLARLDGFEGHVPGRQERLNAYGRQLIEIRPHSGGGPLACWTYVAQVQSGGPFLANPAYMRHLLAGAAQWGLPDDYVAALGAIATSP